jgi:hypothetical protein
MRAGSDACIMTCFLQYTKNGNEEFLEGTYISMNTTDSSDCGRGTVFLRKVPTSDFFKEPFLVEREKEKKKPLASNKPPARVTPKPGVKKNPPAQSPGKKPDSPVAGSTRPIEPKVVEKKRDEDPSRELKRPTQPLVIPPVLKNRENEIVKVFTVNTREITVSLYDNGTIDKDTVSVYLNKKQVVYKKMLSLSPIILTIQLDDDNDYQELVMVAENLGEIPPNTSLMVVKAGNQQFEARITSNEQKNAVVVFKYEKPK